MKSRTSFIFLMLFLSVVFTIYQAGTARAFPDGISGYSGNPATNGGAICNSCHFGGITPSVSLSGPNSVETGSTHTYTLTITGGQEIEGGFDVSVTNGSLTAVDPLLNGTKTLSGEVVHSFPKAASAGTVSWSFDWTAPATETTVTMYGSGNSTNGDGGTSGDAANSNSLSITVQAPPPLNQPPVADAGGPYSAIAGDPVQFDASGSSDPDGTIVSYEWNFGDGSTGTGVTPTHTYAAAGTYTVSLTVTDDAGATNSQQTTASISDPLPPVNQPPVADAGGPYSAIAGDPVQFDASGSSDPDGTILSYDWDFGDGSPMGSGPTPIHTYAAPGSYVVTLTVTDNGSLTNSVQTTAQILATVTPTIVRFKVPEEVEVEPSEEPTKMIYVAARLDGVTVKGTICGTAFLGKNGIAYQDQEICFAPDSITKFTFQHTFTSADAPSVEWTAYVMVGGVDSQHLTKSTEVEEEWQERPDDDDDHDDDDDDHEDN